MFHIISYLLNIKLSTSYLVFSGGNYTLSCRPLFSRDVILFAELVIFYCFRPNPYTRMCVSTLATSSTSGTQSTKLWWFDS